MDRAACHGSEHPPPPPDRPLAARGPGRKPWHILGENGWRILTENLHEPVRARRPRSLNAPGQRRTVSRLMIGEFNAAGSTTPARSGPLIARRLAFVVGDPRSKTAYGGPHERE